MLSRLDNAIDRDVHHSYYRCYVYEISIQIDLYRAATSNKPTALGTCSVYQLHPWPCKNRGRSTAQVWCVHSTPNFSLPWQRRRQHRSSGSGFVIDAKRRVILTNAHCIEWHTQARNRLESTVSPGF